jgi:EAL domain-containing protein (putative c-di-GMP-specific phosphodiesterase class I)
MNQEVLRRVEAERDCAGGDIARVHYQPQFDLRSGWICAARALIRWRHPHAAW